MRSLTADNIGNDEARFVKMECLGRNNWTLEERLNFDSTVCFRNFVAEDYEEPL